MVSVCTRIRCIPIPRRPPTAAQRAGGKPLSPAWRTATIIEAQDRNGVTVGTMVQRRFYRPCMRIHQAIEDGKIGRPVLGHGHHAWLARQGLLQQRSPGEGPGTARAAASW